MRTAASFDTECGIMGGLAVGKTLQQMRKSQLGWRIEESQMVAEANRVEWRRPGIGGSHVIFSVPGVRRDRLGTRETAHKAVVHQTVSGVH